MTWLQHFWFPIRTFIMALLHRAHLLPPAQSALVNAVSRVIRERQAQDAKWGARIFPSGGLGFGGSAAKSEMERQQALCDRAMAEKTCTFAHVIREEVAELIACETEEEALAEATQVGAVILKLIEYLQHHDALHTRPLRVYVTAEPGQKLIAASLASVLHDQGHVIVSRWHKEPTPRADNTSRLAALRDRTKAIRSADVVVAWMVDCEPNASLGEVGYALGFGKPVMMVKGSDDTRDNLFESEKHVMVAHLDDHNALNTVGALFEVFAARVRKVAR